MSYLKILEKRVPLNDTYENVIGFKSLHNANNELVLNHITRDNYFKVYDSHFKDTQYYSLINFNYHDGLTTDIKVNVGLDLSVSERNYVHILNNDITSRPSELFYFIKDFKYLGKGIARLYLVLDVFTTYGPTMKLGSNLTNIFSTARCHCDRFQYNDFVGCDEALLPDVIDGQFKAHVLKTHERLNFKNGQELYAIVYLTNNLEDNLKLDRYSVYRRIDSEEHLWRDEILIMNSLPEKIVKNNSKVKDLKMPYQVGIIPLNTRTIGFYNDNTTIGESLTSFFDYGLNARGKHVDGSPTEYTYYDKLLENPKVLSIQIVNNNFIDRLFPKIANPFSYREIKVGKGSENYNIYSLQLETYQHPTFRTLQVCTLPILIINNFEEVKDTANIEYVDLLKRCEYKGYSTGGLKRNAIRRGEKRIGEAYEPKLYTRPYARFTYTSATEKEYDIESFLAFDSSMNITFEKVFTPQPTNNGEMTFITSGIYTNYKSNFNGSSPLGNCEIPTLTNDYEQFLATQKNSYYQGVALSYFQNIIGSGGSVINFATQPNIATGSNAISNLGNLIAKPFEVNSKMSDLQNAPTKLNINNFDCYATYNITDFDKYINAYTLIDIEIKRVEDFYYRFGYLVEQDREIRYNSDYSIICKKENGLITRSLFNYIKLGQDVSNFISSENMPYIVRTQISNILTRGVRIWYIENANEFLDFTKENVEVN